MTKADMIEKLAKETGLNKEESSKMVNAVLGILIEALSKGERIAIPGLGVFNIRERKARKGRNPRTGKEIVIPAKKVVVFSVAKSLKNEINNSLPL